MVGTTNKVTVNFHPDLKHGNHDFNYFSLQQAQQDAFTKTHTINTIAYCLGHIYNSTREDTSYLDMENNKRDAENTKGNNDTMAKTESELSSKPTSAIGEALEGPPPFSPRVHPLTSISEFGRYLRSYLCSLEHRNVPPVKRAREIATKIDVWITHFRSLKARIEYILSSEPAFANCEAMEGSPPPTSGNNSNHTDPYSVVRPAHTALAMFHNELASYYKTLREKAAQTVVNCREIAAQTDVWVSHLQALKAMIESRLSSTPTSVATRHLNALTALVKDFSDYHSFLTGYAGPAKGVAIEAAEAVDRDLKHLQTLETGFKWIKTNPVGDKKKEARDTASFLMTNNASWRESLKDTKELWQQRMDDSEAEWRYLFGDTQQTHGSTIASSGGEPRAMPKSSTSVRQAAPTNAGSSASGANIPAPQHRPENAVTNSKADAKRALPESAEPFGRRDSKKSKKSRKETGDTDG